MYSRKVLQRKFASQGVMEQDKEKLRRTDPSSNQLYCPERNQKLKKSKQSQLTANLKNSYRNSSDHAFEPIEVKSGLEFCSER